MPLKKTLNLFNNSLNCEKLTNKKVFKKFIREITRKHKSILHVSLENRVKFLNRKKFSYTSTEITTQRSNSIGFCYVHYLEFLSFNSKVWKVCPFVLLKGRQIRIRCASFGSLATFLTQRNFYVILNTKTLISTALSWTSAVFFNSPQFRDLVVYDRPGKMDRFTILYQFLNLKFAKRPLFSVQVNERLPVPSLTKIFLSAGWLEREAWDRFGVFFTLHGDLRRILTDYGFSGFPLRKDFPLSGFIECYYDDSTKRVAYQNVELSQENRQYTLTSTWTAVKT